MNAADPARRCLVVGSYPPVPGLASEATLAAVKRCWAAGAEVVVASPRPSAAHELVPFPGASAAARVAKLGRQHACQEVVVCLQPGWPFLGYDRQLRLGPWYPNLRARAVMAWARCLGNFTRAELVVTGEVPLTPSLFARLWPVVDRVVASSEDNASRLRAMGAPLVEVVVPDEVPSLFGDATQNGDRLAHLSSIGPLEPGSLLLVARTRRLLGAVARAVLGPRAPAVRARLGRYLRL